jgi:DNA-binding transcriptional ArsR family regulator
VRSQSEADKKVSLKGNALRIYWYLLQQERPAGIRDVQRALHLSSPSLVRHHLNRLQSLGLVERAEDGVVAVRNVSVDALQSFISLGRLQLPRQVFYLTFFVTLLIYAALFVVRSLTTESILLLGALIFGLGSSAYEV